MANNVRFLDQVSVSSFGDGGGGSSISSSYAETASFAHFATSASYAVSASHEIIKEISSSYADTASFAQSGNGIFSGSFSGSYEGDGSCLSGIIIDGETTTNNTIPIFADAPKGGCDNSQAISDSSITYNGESYFFNGINGGGVLFQKNGGPPGGSRITIAPDDSTTEDLIITPSLLESNSETLSIQGNKFTALTNGTTNTATWDGSKFDLFNNDDGNLLSLRSEGEITFIPNNGNGGEVTLYFPKGSVDYDIDLPTGNGTLALLNNSGSGDFQATGSFTGSFIGDGSQLTGVDPFPFSGSAVITGSLVVSGSATPIEVIGSGSRIFSVQGSLGELFAIDDQLSGSLLVVNDISGLPQFEVFSDGRTLIGAEPRSLYTTATINATAAATSESIYSLSTSSYDGVFFDYTVTSASNARAGNIMSIWNGGSIVYTENTTTDIGSTVGVTFNVEISQSQAQLISVTDTAGWKIKTTIRSI